MVVKQVVKGFASIASLANQIMSQPVAALGAMRVWLQGLSMLGLYPLIELQQGVSYVENASVPGILVEAGVARGGSAIAIALARRSTRPLYLYDTFEGIPAPTEADGFYARLRYSIIRSGRSEGRRGQIYYGYEPNLQSFVEHSLQQFGLSLTGSQIHLVKGLYRDTLFPPDMVALAHIDCDWYESVRICLERITPVLSPGGLLIVDDYDYWPGCRRAVDEFFEDKHGQFLFVHRSRLHIVRHF